VDSGLFESIGVNYYTLNHVGPITIEGETTPQRLREALAALRDEIGKLSDSSYFAKDQLEAVKQRRTVDTELNLERASGFAHQVGFWWAVTGLDYFYGYVDNMAKQRPADLAAYAAKYIVGKPHVTGVLLSPGARRSLNLTMADLTEPRIRP
jgi:zinc protease